MTFRINNNIFNDVQNINSKVEYLRDDLGDDSAALDVLDDHRDVMERIAKQESDPDDMAQRVKDLMKDGDDRETAKDEAREDNYNDTWGDGALQLKFVPRDSVLGNALNAYFYHLNPAGTVFQNIRKFVRGAVISDNPEGFYFATGLGYFTPDDLFSGVPVKNKHNPDGCGSGMPAKRFLDYINGVKAVDC